MRRIGPAAARARGRRLGGLLGAVVAALPAPGLAASLEGITMPETRVVDGTTLYLNGMALRTYSILRVHIYVAGLYLERPSRDGNEILRSPEKKLLDIRFVHDVDAASARKAWLEGFDNNCLSPCRLERRDVDTFLSRVTDMSKNSTSTLIFTPGQVAIELDGRMMGAARGPLAYAILASFIGPVPPTERVKQELLAGSR